MGRALHKVTGPKKPRKTQGLDEPKPGDLPVTNLPLNLREIGGGPVRLNILIGQELSPAIL